MANTFLEEVSSVTVKRTLSAMMFQAHVTVIVNSKTFDVVPRHQLIEKVDGYSNS